MRRVIIHVVVAALVGVSVAGAAPLNAVRVAVEQGGTNRVARMLAGYGITNVADVAAIMAGWDEDVCIDAAIRNRAFNLMAYTLSLGKLTPANMERIKVAVLAEKEPPPCAPDIAMKFPVAQRSAFKAAVAPVCATRFATQPELGRLWMKYTFLQGIPITSSEVSLEDVVSYLLAPDPLGLTEAESWKQTIKGRVVELARTTLRAEGKSFVVKDGVNPLVAKVQPVVDALNAPACEGLEEALRGLGGNVRDMDRGELKKVVETWRAQVMRGDLGNDAARFLGKISIVLGADRYNRFVDEYNNGKAGAK